MGVIRSPLTSPGGNPPSTSCKWSYGAPIHGLVNWYLGFFCPYLYIGIITPFIAGNPHVQLEIHRLIHFLDFPANHVSFERGVPIHWC